MAQSSENFNEEILTQLEKHYFQPERTEAANIATRDLSLLFEACPHLQAIYIRQHTPGFCDGEQCEQYFEAAVIMSDGIIDNFDLPEDIWVFDKNDKRLNGQKLENFTKLNWDEQKASGLTVEGYRDPPSWVWKNFLPVVPGLYKSSPAFSRSVDPVGHRIFSIVCGMRWIFTAWFTDNFQLFITNDHGKAVVQSKTYRCDY